MLTIFRWDVAAHQGEWLNAAHLRHRHPGPDNKEIWWINLYRPTAEEERLVHHEFLPLHDLTIEDLSRPFRETTPHLPKVEEFGEAPHQYLFVVLNPLRNDLTDAVLDAEMAPGKGSLTAQLGAILTHTVLITQHYEPLAGIDALKAHLQRLSQSAGRGPDYLFHIAIDASVDAYAPILDRLTDTFERLEGEVFRKHHHRLHERLLRLKRLVLRLRKSLVLERDVLERLHRGDFELIDERERAYYRNVYDHLVRSTELIDSARDMTSDLMQTHLAAVSNRLNEVMKVLTMISTIGMLCTLIAGIYGMNFDHMPELHWTYGYPFALGLMAFATSLAFVYFRWRRWI